MNTVSERRMVRDLTHDVSACMRYDRALETNGADEQVRDLRDQKVRTVQTYPEPVVQKAFDKFAKHGDAGRPYAVALERYRQAPQSTSVTRLVVEATSQAVVTAQAAKVQWNEAVRGGVTVRWRDVTRDGVLLRQFAIFAGESTKTGQEAAERIMQTGYEFGENVLKDPYAQFTNGEYFFEVPLDAEYMTLTTQRKQFNHGREDGEASGLMMCIAGAVTNGAAFTYKGTRYDGLHWVRCREFPGVDDLPVRMVGAGDGRASGRRLPA